MADIYPTAEDARITCAIVDAAASVRDLNFKYLQEGKGATVTARLAGRHHHHRSEPCRRRRRRRL